VKHQELNTRRKESDRGGKEWNVPYYPPIANLCASTAFVASFRGKTFEFNRSPDPNIGWYLDCACNRDNRDRELPNIRASRI